MAVFKPDSEMLAAVNGSKLEYMITDLKTPIKLTDIPNPRLCSEFHEIASYLISKNYLTKVKRKIKSGKSAYLEYLNSDIGVEYESLRNPLILEWFLERLVRGKQYKISTPIHIRDDFYCVVVSNT